MASDIVKQISEMTARVEAGLQGIKHKIGVMSGKGGVGKSTVTVNLAIQMAEKGYRVGILDADINGPSIPNILGIVEKRMEVRHGKAHPVTAIKGIKVASMALLLSGRYSPVMWKGPMNSASVWLGAMEMSAVREFLSDVAWGKLDFLFIDLPPGAGDKPVSIASLIPGFDGVVVVTTPSTISSSVVARSIGYAKKLSIPVLGIIENMRGFICPTCGAEVELFYSPEKEGIEEIFDVPILGRIPFDPRITVFSGDERGDHSVKAFEGIVAKLLESVGEEKSTTPP